jgi:hypothetical protein
MNVVDIRLKRIRTTIMGRESSVIVFIGCRPLLKVGLPFAALLHAQQSEDQDDESLMARKALLQNVCKEFKTICRRPRIEAVSSKG